MPRAADFVLFARGTSTVGRANFTCVAEVQVHVTVKVDSEQQGELAPVTVNPGDVLVVGDSGVVCVPKQSNRTS